MDRQLIVMLIIAVLCAATGFFAGCAHIERRDQVEQPPVWLSPASIDAIADAVHARLRPATDWVVRLPRSNGARLADMFRDACRDGRVTSPGHEQDAERFIEWLRGGDQS